MENTKIVDKYDYRRHVPAKERELVQIKDKTEDELRKMGLAGTLCWNCIHAIDLQCPWFNGFHPVKGWVAKKAIVEPGVGNGNPTYMIYDCPMFYPCEEYRNMMKAKFEEQSRLSKKKKEILEEKAKKKKKKTTIVKD